VLIYMHISMLQDSSVYVVKLSSFAVLTLPLAAIVAVDTGPGKDRVTPFAHGEVDVLARGPGEGTPDWGTIAMPALGCTFFL